MRISADSAQFILADLAAETLAAFHAVDMPGGDSTRMRALIVVNRLVIAEMRASACVPANELDALSSVVDKMERFVNDTCPA